MVETLVLVGIGVIAYAVGAMALQRLGYLPASLSVSGPITTIHTRRGRAFLDRLARHRRFWRAWANVGVGFAFLVGVGMFLTVVFSGFMGVSQPEANPIQEPTDALVLPGVNDFLPLAAAPEIILGLAIAMVVHEGGHGLLCRVEDIDIESMGVALFTVIPIGAFVEPDEKSRQAADRGAKTRMFAAGVTNNFALTLVAILLLFGPVAGSIQAVDGVAVGGVAAGSPADQAGIERGDVITAINESTVTLHGGETVPIDRSVTVMRAVVDGPLNLSANATITAVDSTTVSTEQEFAAAMANRTVATLQTADGSTTTGPVGAFASVVLENQPLANASGLAGESVVITRVGDHRISTDQELTDALDQTDPGDVVEIRAFVDGTEQNYTVTLGRSENGEGFLGVGGIQSGYSGVRVADFGFGIQEYPAERNLAILGGDVDGFDQTLSEQFLWFLTLPFISLLEAGTFGFAGFIGGVTNFYTINGPLAILGGWTFLLANLLFWTAWINVNVGMFNLIPLYPLDGGHILRTSTEAILSRTPLNRRWAVKGVTVSIGLVMFASLLVMLFGSQFL